MRPRIATCEACGYAYYRVPKAATSTVMRTLAYHDPHMPDVLGNDVDVKRMFGHKLTPRMARFTFVRDPYTRVLSAYLDKIVAGRSYKGTRDYATKMRQRGVEDTGFADFVGYLERGGLYDNKHWAPQVELLGDTWMAVYRVECIIEDLEALCNHLFGEWYGVQDSSEGLTHAGAHARDYYTEELRERVYALYRKDFEELGYSK